MRFKAFQRLLATTLLFVSSAAVWAQPDLVGGEFKVNQNQTSRQLAPVVAFSPSGSSLIVWENDINGILGRFYDRNGAALSAELTLVPNKKLPTVPGAGDVIIRKEPALVYLPNGEFLIFWTEEPEYLSVSYFYEYRKILEQDVRGQRFSAKGERLGDSFLVNQTSAGFQRRPQAVLRSGGVLVVWEGDTNTKDSLSVHGRMLTRRGMAQGSEFRVDAGRATEVRDLAVAATPSGEALIVWEADLAGSPEILGRLIDRNGAARGGEVAVNAATLGRQRRPAVIATRDGGFLVSWQSFVDDTPIHGIVGQFFNAGGARTGSEMQLSRGTGEIQISPSLALLASGNIVVTWLDWVGTYPIGVYAVLVDSAGRRLGDEIAINQDRVYPQYQNSVAANPQGEILAVWEGRVQNSRAIAARRLSVD